MHDGLSAEPLPTAIRDALSTPAPRATRFIVTIYGDVAEPRGGTLAMGTLIETCAAHGISESLARTAVSRLVASGRLDGERVGRRSFYRLTDAARAEFRAAARLFYDPWSEARGWLFALGEAALPEDLSSVAWARIAPDLALAPDRPDVTRPDAPLVAGTALTGQAPVAFAAAHWDLSGVGEAYRAFLRRYAPVAAALGSGPLPEAEVCLALRLRLVHAYRQAVLSDPRLPVGTLPRDWPGPEARTVFATAYLRLAEMADAHIGASFVDAGGALPAETDATRARLASLRRVLAPAAGPAR
ncbi:PaaX family transcriptional regulator C-terminal domain-containing protein [Roseivivax sediminis]|uniref:Transcriptional regulator, PaaX family n=1 Tax=Roseivivax sediminis TaxID=936889 RepID=A0A1I2CEM2_9RHOB|nr:PaaX family transcriptional regulator C-terminal domain-containing protein [Roseivivax sediminis]SFE66746.1 transcriptional regulator, PaaX family [Roseivivax sediminis]